MAPQAPSPTTERRAGARQIGLGAVLLVVGVALSVLLVQSGANTAAAWGYVVAVVGLVLVVNGVVLRRKRPQPARR